MAAALTSAPPDLLGLSLAELGATLDAIGVGAAHAGRVFGGLHRRLQPLDAIEGLGPRHAARIADATFAAEATVEATHPSDDGTEKLVFRLGDGARVEGVLIPMRGDRLALCVSSQVGCAMACAFCATGALGLTRGLRAGEIVAQLHAARRRVEPAGRRVSHVVFMGMGEPLHHYAATRDAVRVLREPRGVCIAAQRITVSTVGVVPKMRAFAADFGGRVQLALSLHAGTDATRRRIIPLAATHDLAALKAALLDHPLPGRRALMLEYVVLPGVNDDAAELEALAAWTRDLRCLVNLIPFNPFPGAPFRAPDDATVRRVGATLEALKVPHSIRWPRGRRVAGACGQLALVTP